MQEAVNETLNSKKKKKSWRALTKAHIIITWTSKVMCKYFETTLNLFIGTYFFKYPSDALVTDDNGHQRKVRKVWLDLDKKSYELL